MVLNKLAKIIATLGPSSCSYDIIEQMVDAGVNVFRLNFSHGTHDDKKNIIQHIRAIEKQKKCFLTILGDLQGPKIRVGNLPTQLLENHQIVHLFLGDNTEKLGELPVPTLEVFDVLTVGTYIYINDGFLKLEVLEKQAHHVTAKILIGGEISSHKGLNVPNVLFPIPALTEQDKCDLEFAINNGIDWIALSFVQHKKDVQEAQSLIKGKARLLAKIERSKAIENIDEIIQYVDAIMIARGDLGIEILLEQLPTVQRHIIKKCRENAIPVTVATEMLQSMIHNARPTRAEVSDVANAIYEGADSVMLSGETATGQYPVEAVKVMNTIIQHAEDSEFYKDLRVKERSQIQGSSDNEVIAHCAVEVAERLNCRAVATFTQTGTTTIRASQTRTFVPLLSLTPSVTTARMMGLIWGVYAITTRDDIHSFEDMVGKATRLSRQHGITNNGDRITVTAGVPFGNPGTTNVIRVCTVGEHEKSS